MMMVVTVLVTPFSSAVLPSALALPLLTERQVICWYRTPLVQLEKMIHVSPPP